MNKMKITKHQLRRIIRESYMKQLYVEIENMVLELADPEMLTIHVDDMIAEWRVRYPKMDIELLWGAVDLLESEGILQSEGSSGWYHVVNQQMGRPMNEAWMVSGQGFSPMKSRVDPEFVKLIKGIVTEVCDEDDDEPNPFGTGNMSVHDPDKEEELVGHT